MCQPTRGCTKSVPPTPIRHFRNLRILTSLTAERRRSYRERDLFDLLCTSLQLNQISRSRLVLQEHRGAPKCLLPLVGPRPSGRNCRNGRRLPRPRSSLTMPDKPETRKDVLNNTQKRCSTTEGSEGGPEVDQLNPGDLVRPSYTNLDLSSPSGGPKLAELNPLRDLRLIFCEPPSSVPEE